MDQNEGNTSTSRPDVRRHSSPNYEDQLFRQEDSRRASEGLEDSQFLRVSARAIYYSSQRRKPRRPSPAPEQLARNLLQFGCPVVLMPEPRQGAGTEQLAISSDSDDSTTPQQGQNGSNQGQSHTKSQGQPNGFDLPTVHVSGPSDNPDILSSNHGSAGSLGARSAPSTPLQGNIGTNPLTSSSSITTPLSSSVGSNSLQTPKSPTHGSLKCSDSTISKPLSKSTPSMAAVNNTTIAVIKTTKSSPMTTSSSARQKKFHRHFTQVAPDECVLNYYSCALVGDILLQGHLYITPNYFAFYSNVFGYVTKLLIPATSVLKISKEKTAKIIPNAVAIVTIDERHVFCSLLSRDSTYKLMKQVWDAAMEPKLAEEILPLPVENKLLVPQTLLVDDSEVNPEEDDSSMSESGVDLERSPVVRSDLTTCADDTEVESVASTNIPRPSLTVTRLESSSPPSVSKFTKRNTMGSLKCFASNGLSASTVITILVAILAALYVSAALMMIRIDRLHTAYLNHPLASPDRFTQDRLLNYLNTNLDQIVKIRQSLQTLSKQFVMINQADGRDGTASGTEMDPEDAPS